MTSEPLHRRLIVSIQVRDVAPVTLFGAEKERWWATEERVLDLAPDADPGAVVRAAVDAAVATLANR